MAVSSFSVDLVIWQSDDLTAPRYRPKEGREREPPARPSYYSTITNNVIAATNAVRFIPVSMKSAK